MVHPFRMARGTAAPGTVLRMTAVECTSASRPALQRDLIGVPSAAGTGLR
jgi:hypothetical protein